MIDPISALLSLILAAPASAAPGVAWQGAGRSVPAVRVPVTAVPQASVLAPALAAPLLPGFPAAAPALPGLYPSLLPSPAALQPAGLSVVPVAPSFPVPGARLEAYASVVAPELAVIASPSRVLGEAKLAGERLQDALLAAPSGGGRAPSAPSAGPSGAGSSGGGRRGGGGRPGSWGSSKPLVSKVSYADGLSQEHRDLFDRTLRRRKAAWIRGLVAQGVSLEGPVEPILSVREARGLTPGGGREARYADFVVDWTQGQLKVGSFRVTVRLKDLQVTLRGLPPPPVPASRQLRIRFRKSITVEGIRGEVGEAAIKVFLESRRLRLLHRDYRGFHVAAVTGEDTAEAVARELNAKGLVLYATPAAAEAPEGRRLSVVFKSETARGERSVPVGEEDIARVLGEEGLTVLEATREGRWTLASPEGVDGAEAARRLAAQGAVLYASAAGASAPEEAQVILRFPRGAADDAKAVVLGGMGLVVLEDLGAGAYRVAGEAGPPNGTLASALGSLEAVESAVPVGRLPEERVRAAAKGAASYKGGIYSATEFSLYTHNFRMGLVLEGATRAQLELFERLLAEEPVRGGRFNPWSGD